VLGTKNTIEKEYFFIELDGRNRKIGERDLLRGFALNEGFSFHKEQSSILK